MENVANKIDGSSTLPAAEFNSHKNELQDLVTESGQSLALATPDQLRKAVSVYSRSLIMEDSSVTPNVLTLARPNGLTDVPAYFDGMIVMFTTPNANTGATTVTVNGLTSKKVRTPSDAPLPANSLQVGVLHIVRYVSSFDLGNGAFVLESTKNALSYDNNTSSFIANTLASGSIIERGSNANGTYIKFADGTLICTFEAPSSTTANYIWTFPSAFVDVLYSSSYMSYASSGSDYTDRTLVIVSKSTTQINFLRTQNSIANNISIGFSITVKGKWK